MSDPFKIEGPAAVSFSGGRTSGYMLWHILQANGGALPPDVLVVFCNTGKERPETLDFVERCSAEWGVPVTWLEYRFTPGVREPGKAAEREAQAAREARVRGRELRDRQPGNGEPFEAVILARNMLPNPVSRFCTVEMKIRTTDRYLRSLGWRHWTNCHRVPGGRAAAGGPRPGTTNRHSREDPVAPLHAAGVLAADVIAWWKAQPFDLGLESYEGNCDLCFLKGIGKVQRVMRDRPDLAAWWIEMETRIKGGRTGTGRFRSDRPGYAATLELSKRPTLFPLDDPDELSVACHCTD
jgi:hypothetical protein